MANELLKLAKRYVRAAATIDACNGAVKLGADPALVQDVIDNRKAECDKIRTRMNELSPMFFPLPTKTD